MPLVPFSVWRPVSCLSGWLSPRAGGPSSAGCPAPLTVSLPPQVFPMTPPGRLYLRRVCSTPILLLLGLLLALPPEAQVRQQESGPWGQPCPTLGLRASLMLFSPRGSLASASHPQLHSLPISTPQSTWPEAPSNLPLTSLVNIHLASQTCSPQPSSYAPASGTEASLPPISPHPLNGGIPLPTPSQPSPRNSVQHLLPQGLRPPTPRSLTPTPSGSS